MLYIIFNTAANKYIDTKNGQNYNLVSGPSDATAMIWEEVVRFYNKSISPKRRKDCMVTYQDSHYQYKTFHPLPGDPEPALSELALPEKTEGTPVWESSQGGYFLVDYENVNEAGLEGVNYLIDKDHVTLFYSSSVPTMKRRIFKAIEDSGCAFELCYLGKKGKNALDFYIVSRLGEIFGGGYSGAVCIVSQDNGFQAASDYWSAHARQSRVVLCYPTVEHGILLVDGGSQRAADIREMSGKINITLEYARYEERKKLRGRLEQVLKEIGCTDRMEDAEALLKEKKNKKVVYLTALHTFGHQKGLELYQRLKTADLI